MRDKPKPPIRKTLVRNAEIPVSTTVLTLNSNPSEAGNSQPKRKNSNQNNGNQRKETVSLGEPALNSALRIVKEMKQTNDLRPSRMQPTPDFTEKVSHKMNVPYNEYLYHDLVALSVSDIPTSENVNNIKVKPHKQDCSPDLSDFLIPSCVADIPVVVTHNFPHHAHAPVWDGRNVYLATEEVKHDCYD